MTNKTFTLLSLGILVLLVLTSFASATITFSNVPTLSIDEGNHSNTLTITTDEVLSDVSMGSITKDSQTISFIVSNISSVSPYTYTINYTVPSGFNFEFGEVYSTNLSITGSVSGVVNQKLSFAEQTNFCSYDGNSFDLSNDDYLDITTIDITNNGFGDEENWYPFDEIEVAVTVKSPDSDVDMADISLEWGLYDQDAKQWVIDVDEADEFDVDGGDKEVITFTFKLDDDMDMDLDEIEGHDFILYVRATGKADSDESVDGKKLCISESLDDSDFEITIDKFVLLDNIQITDFASCGSEVQVTADVWNIGGSKQKDVVVLISNKELGISKKVELGDIKAFDSVDLSTTITLPNDADEKKYTLTFYVYDDDGELYEVGKDDDQSIFYSSLTLQDCSSTPTASVSASLQSEAKAGQDLVVKATIVNTGSTAKTFTLSASSYTDWASSAILDRTSVTLNAGASQEVLITLKVLNDASGENGFDIEVVDGSKFLSQPVAVTIENSFSFPSLTGLFTGFSDNAYLYGIIALNILLVAAIVFVAVKVARRKKQE